MYNCVVKRDIHIYERKMYMKRERTRYVCMCECYSSVNDFYPLFMIAHQENR